MLQTFQFPFHFLRMTQPKPRRTDILEILKFKSVPEIDHHCRCVTKTSNFPTCNKTCIFIISHFRKQYVLQWQLRLRWISRCWPLYFPETLRMAILSIYLWVSLEISLDFFGHFSGYLGVGHSLSQEGCKWLFFVGRSYSWPENNIFSTVTESDCHYMAIRRNMIIPYIDIANSRPHIFFLTENSIFITVKASNLFCYCHYHCHCYLLKYSVSTFTI